MVFSLSYDRNLFFYFDHLREMPVFFLLRNPCAGVLGFFDLPDLNPLSWFGPWSPFLPSSRTGGVLDSAPVFFPCADWPESCRWPVEEQRVDDRDGFALPPQVLGQWRTARFHQSLFCPEYVRLYCLFLFSRLSGGEKRILILQKDLFVALHPLF